jgi:peroxiredoxin
MRSDIVIGSTFPDYELPDQDGVPRRLSDLQGRDPMIVVLSRGSYCPKDQEQHRRLAELQPELEVGYCRMATISTDDLPTTKGFRAMVDARWPFLSDPRLRTR